MGMDADTKAYLDNFKTSIEESFKDLKRQLARSEEENARLVQEVGVLRLQLERTQVELDAYKRSEADIATDIAAVRQSVTDAIAAAKADCGRVDLRVDDLEQYGRRKNIRVQDVTVVEGESDDITLVLEQINVRLEPTGVQIREADCIRYHRSSKEKDDRDVTGAKVSQCIVKLKHWSARRIFQGMNSKNRAAGYKARVYHDLTKRRLNLLNKARTDLAVHPGWFPYADVNSNLKIRSGTRFYSFNTEVELSEAINKI